MEEAAEVVSGKPQMTINQEVSLPPPGHLSPRKSMDGFGGPLNRTRALGVEIGERGEAMVLVNPSTPLITENDLSE